MFFISINRKSTYNLHKITPHIGKLHVEIRCDQLPHRPYRRPIGRYSDWSLFYYFKKLSTSLKNCTYVVFVFIFCFSVFMLFCFAVDAIDCRPISVLENKSYRPSRRYRPYRQLYINNLLSSSFLLYLCCIWVYLLF